ncbi:MAG TPA: nucleotidyltransferase domain-containing protein [Candidatus Nanoarchaeia archaeon]|nr:nucleotidyltransferase domain-containing protein [Candidatus Nanoarchaeia archaeon]
MEINKNELKIIEFYRNNLFFSGSIREIMQKLKSKSYQRIYEAVEELIKKKILNSKKIGNNRLISLDLSRETILLFSFMDEKEAYKIPNYSKILDIKEISDFLILVTGSYANGTYTKKSDLDLVIVIPDKDDVVYIQKLVENITMLYTPSIHLYVFRKKDFVEMLKSKEQTYAKEIVHKKLIIKNARIFYEVLKEAIENGYKC